MASQALEIRNPMYPKELKDDWYSVESGVRRVTVQIFLRFQEKSPDSEENVHEIQTKSRINGLLLKSPTQKYLKI